MSLGLIWQSERDGQLIINRCTSSTCSKQVLMFFLLLFFIPSYDVQQCAHFSKCCRALQCSCLFSKWSLFTFGVFSVSSPACVESRVTHTKVLMRLSCVPSVLKTFLGLFFKKKKKSNQFCCREVWGEHMDNYISSIYIITFCHIAAF